MPKYYLEFILSGHAITERDLRESLGDCGQGLEVLPLPQACGSGGSDFKIRIHTEDPTVVFDVSAQFGRIRSMKIEEKVNGR